MTVRALRLSMWLLMAAASGSVACDETGALFRDLSPLAPPAPMSPSGAGGADSAWPMDASAPSSVDAAAGSGGSRGAGLGNPDPGDGLPLGDAGPDRADAGGEGGATVTPPNGSGGGAGAELTPPPTDGTCGNQCVRNGGRCSEGACIFDCDRPGTCTTDQVLCPAGRPCEVRCGNGSCTENVVCGEFAVCNIVCEGASSCASEVICDGECNVTCSGPRSCSGGIGGSVDLLELECSGAQSCGSTVSCQGQDCQISCSGSQSCPRVRSTAVQNSVECSGAGSCGSDVLCLGVTCSVECEDNACDNGVDCDALRCDLGEEDD